MKTTDTVIKEMNNELMEKYEDRIPHLPLFHQEVMEDMFDLDAWSGSHNDSIAERIASDFHTSFNGDLVGEIYRESLEMLGYPVSEYTDEPAQAAASVPVAEEEAESDEIRPEESIFIYSKKCTATGGNGRHFPVRIIVKDETGEKNLDIIEKNGKTYTDWKDERQTVYDYSDIIARHEGLLIVRSLTWHYADLLDGSVKNSDDLKNRLSEDFEGADFVEFPEITDLYWYNGNDSVLEDDSLQMTTESLRGAKNNMRVIASTLEEMGIGVMPVWEMDRYRLHDAFLDYLYMGEAKAEEMTRYNLEGVLDKLGCNG